MALRDLPARSRPPRTLRARLGAQLPRKLAILGGLSVGICVPYFALQRLRILPLRPAPATPLDDWIAFDPSWLPVYLSLGLLVPLAPLLATRRDELRRYARGLALLCAACFTCFLLAPVEGPRPAAPAPHPGYALLARVDAPSNSMPSLHAGLAVYSILFGLRALDGAGRRPRTVALLAGWGWGGLIAVSTLATKQHWALDLPVGGLLACAAHAWAWRAAPQPGRALAPSDA